MTSRLRHVTTACFVLGVLCGPANGALAQVPDTTRPSPSAPGPPAKITSEARMSLQLESLSNGTDWHDASLEITSDAGSPGRWYAAFHEVGRFSLRDEHFSGGYAHPVGKRAVMSIEAQGSFSHRVVPQFGAAGRVDVRVGRGWVLNSGVSGRRYDTGAVTIVTAGLEKYVGRFRLAYTSYGAFLAGEESFSNALSFDTTYGSGDDNLFGVTVAAGDELEQDVRAALRASEVRAVSARGRHWLGRRVGLLYSIGVHDQGTLYTRRGGTVGIALRF